MSTKTTIQRTGVRSAFPVEDTLHGPYQLYFRWKLFNLFTSSQDLSDWIGSHVRALEYFGGIPEVVVLDNLRSAVTKAHRYEPDLNPTYQDLAQHYGMAIVPARVRKPRDKAKAEAGVLLVQRWILAVLRNEIFFSLESLNRQIQRLLRMLCGRDFLLP